MSTVRNVFVDLVDKRLWPLAALLVIALIAVPLVLAKPADRPAPGKAAVTPTVAPPAGLPAPGTAVSLASTDAAKERVTGASHDPFKQVSGTVSTATTGSTAATAATASPATGATPGASVPGGATPGAFTTGTTTGGTTTGTTTGTAPTDKADRPEPRTQVVIRFGVSKGSRPQRAVESLTPLPSASRPLFIYLGSTDSASKAVFLVSADAVPTGDGRCEPNKRVCSQVVLRPGETEYFDVQTSKGPVQYQLDVVGLRTVR